VNPEQNECFMAAVEKLIDSADRLTSTEFRTGILLLSVAMFGNGYANFSHEEAGLLCGTDKNATMRAHLIHLRDAGVLSDYSTNGTVRVKFAAYSGREMIVHRRSNSLAEPTNSLAEPTNSLAEPTVTNKDSDSRALSQLLRALRSRDRALSQQLSRNFDDYPQGNHVVVVSSNTTPSVDGNLLTNYTPNALEQAQSVSILLDTDVRAKPKDAYRLSKQHSFLLIREAIAHWWSNRRSVGGKFDETPGIVTHWLDNLEGFSIPKLSAAFLQSDLYQRHRTKDEMDADLIESTPQLQPDQCDPEQEPEGSSDTWPGESDTWNNVLSMLESELPASTYKTWLASTAAVIDEQSLTCTVVCENATTREWLSNRLRQMISRTINTVAQQRYHVQFEVRRRS